MKKKAIGALFGASTAALLLAFLSPVAHAADAGTTAQRTASSGPTEISDEVQATATVESVDLQNRLLTVRDESGTQHVLKVPQAVRKLGQVKKGDHIVVRYRETLATQLTKPGEGSKIIESTQSTTVAPPQARPSSVTQSQTKATIKVQSVDPSRNTLVFVGPKGVPRTAVVHEPKLQSKLRQLKPGDEIEVVYTEELAIDIEPAMARQ